MEDVLDLYEEPSNPKRPKVGFDETPRPLVAETRTPLPAASGQLARYDYEYQRQGTRNLFLFLDPDAGWRHVAITEQRIKIDFARQMKWLVDDGYPDAEIIRVILDNLNTHSGFVVGSLSARRSAANSEALGISVHAETW